MNLLKVSFQYNPYNAKESSFRTELDKMTSSNQTCSSYVRKEIKTLVIFRALFAYVSPESIRTRECSGIICIVSSIITKSMQVLWLVSQLWFIAAVNSWKNRASSELLYKSNRPQVSTIYMLINHAGCWYNKRRIRKSRTAGEWFTSSSSAHTYIHFIFSLYFLSAYKL